MSVYSSHLFPLKFMMGSPHYGRDWRWLRLDLRKREVFSYKFETWKKIQKVRAFFKDISIFSLWNRQTEIFFCKNENFESFRYFFIFLVLRKSSKFDKAVVEVLGADKGHSFIYLFKKSKSFLEIFNKNLLLTPSCWLCTIKCFQF